MVKRLLRRPVARGSFATLAAFVVGVPLGLGALWLVHHGPFDPSIVRYVEHPVECVEVILFCCALTALLLKLFSYLRERVVFRLALLPKAGERPQPASDAASLLNYLSMQRGWRGSWLGRRIQAVLDFVHSRRSVNELDDQLRALSDNDLMAQEGGYTLLRFINWAIPILGFLGTVVGITQAIANVSPDSLNSNTGLSDVTSGLATAFDATALALALTMILMFGTLTLERMEQGLLENVDAYVEHHLAHRFERTGTAATAPLSDGVRTQLDGVVAGVEQLVQKQAQLWGKSLELAERRWAEAGKTQAGQITAALGEALEFALRRHGERLADMEQKLQTRSQALLDGLTNAAKAIEETSKQHRDGLTQIAQQLGAQTSSAPGAVAGGGDARASGPCPGSRSSRTSTRWRRPARSIRRCRA
ncbi:MAG: MotA/TolQ/ExbB proton channel family protein [Gemmataceae bacterium]